MSPDEYQKAWKAESTRTKVAVNADILLKLVQRSQQEFRTAVLLRDFREVGVALLLLPLWFYLGITFSEPWTWYLTVPALLWVIGFIVVDRRRHPQKPVGPGEPLLASVRESLTQVEHQIWLLRNVAWWYLLPFTLSIMAFFVHVSWLTSKSWLEALGGAATSCLFLLVVYGFIYWLNQYAVRTNLKPRREELLALLASLNDGGVNEVSGEFPIITGARRVQCTRRRLVFAGLCFVLLLSIGVAGIYLASHQNERFRKESPFAAVRWQETQPEVNVGGAWFKLVSLDGIPATEIVKFSRQTFGELWQKRFEEDLVELLTRMGHPPGKTVTLVLQSLTTSETWTLEGVPMTRANRRAIYDATRARQRGAPQQRTESAPNDNAERSPAPSE